MTLSRLSGVVTVTFGTRVTPVGTVILGQGQTSVKLGTVGTSKIRK